MGRAIRIGAKKERPMTVRNHYLGEKTELLRSAMLFLFLLSAVALSAQSADTIGSEDSPSSSPVNLDEKISSLTQTVEAILSAPIISPLQTPGAIKTTPEPTPTPTPKPTPAQPPYTSPLTGEASSLIEKYGWPKIIGTVVAVVLVLLFLIWGRGILLRFNRKRRYTEASLLEDQTTVDERLLSELSTLHVALLRGSIQAYYEKVFLLMCRLFRNHGLEDAESMDTPTLISALEKHGADKALIERVQSIGERCDRVLNQNEKPPAAAHEQIATDLRQLVDIPVFPNFRSPRNKPEESESASE